MPISFLLRYLPTLIMLFFNLLTTDRCCHRKYSAARTFFVCALVFVLTPFCSSLLLNATFWQDGKIALLGFLYIIPFRYLYKEKLFFMFVIMCICWTYTMGIHTLSTQLSRILAPDRSLYIYLAAECLLFLITMLPFYRRIVPKFTFILNNVDTLGKQGYRYLALHSCLGFLSLAILNAVFTAEKASLLKLLALILLLLTIYVTDFILYDIVLDYIKMNDLEYTASHDGLTGLGNRTALLKRMQKLTVANQTFSVLFMDLDRFKRINDQYGHAAGDQYLIHFANVCSHMLRENGEVFRYGGDEFVALYSGIIPDETVSRLEECREWDEGAPCPFNKVSVGVLVCRPPHKNTDELLRQADAVMYENKTRKIRSK